MREHYVARYGAIPRISIRAVLLAIAGSEYAAMFIFANASAVATLEAPVTFFADALLYISCA